MNHAHITLSKLKGVYSCYWRLEFPQAATLHQEHNIVATWYLEAGSAPTSTVSQKWIVFLYCSV